MGTCSECGKPDIADTGLCFKHGGRVTPKAVRSPVFNLTDDEGTVSTNQTSEEAKSWLQDRCGGAQYANAPAIIAAMEDGEANSRTKKSGSTSIGVVYHASQGAPGKSGALTAFWIEKVPAVIKIIAVGAHTSSSSYQISWSGDDWKWGSNVSASQIT